VFFGKGCWPVAITVRDLAEAIRRPDESPESVIDRLRNWTDEDLLTLIGDKNPGTGKRRQYAEGAVIEALVLTHLSGAVGRGVTTPSFAKLFRLARKAGVFAQTEGFLTIACSTKLPLQIKTLQADELVDGLKASRHDAHVIMDFAKLNRQRGNK
jgi:hypothetical protein